MKRFALDIVFYAVLTVGVKAHLAGAYKTITLDGSLADWSNPGDVLYTDAEIADGTPSSSSYENVYVANDATNLFVGLDTKGTGGGTINNTWTHRIYLDTDMNASTGFDSDWMIHGYDRMIQYGGGGASYSVFEFTGTSQASWSWNSLGTITYSYSDDIAELLIPLSSLGISGNSCVMELNVSGPGITTETWASQYETGAETYTVAPPPPPPPPPTSPTNFTYTVSTNLLVNPERGLYYSGPLEVGTDYNEIRALDCRLCYANLSLESFRSSNISAARLQEIEDAFSRMKYAGLKCVLRITYDNSSSGLDTTLAWMETHLQQLQPILEDNSELIAFVQAGMIGAWGEWHSSATGLDTPAGRTAVYDLLCTYMPAGKFIQVRTPGFVNELVGLDTNPLDDSSAFTGTPRARIAHHNDAWISSATDLGTYPGNAAERETLKAQIEHHTKYAPWGGESAVLDTNYTQSAYVLDEAERFHATYLNADYNPDVINELIANGSWDVIQKNLGYRIELVSAILPDALVAGEAFDFEIRLQNSGWAPFYNARPVILRILSGSIVIQEIELSTDPRFWRPEAGVIVLSDNVYPVCSVAAEHLGFALWLPDASSELQGRSDYAVQFANENVWDGNRGHNLLKHPASEPIGHIVVDGDLSEWDNPGDILYDDSEISNGSPANSSYEAVYVANDAANLFIGLDTKGSGGGDVFNPWIRNIYIDTDMNGSTGYDMGWMVHGYDRLIQYGGSGSSYSVYAFTGAAQGDWSWNWLGLVTYAYSDDIIELSAPLSWLGASGGDSVVMQFHVTGSGVSSETWADTWESGAKTYTLDAGDATALDSQLVDYDPLSGNIGMEWGSPSNSVFEIDVSPDLETWEFLGRGISDESGNLSIVDHPPVSEQKRFYRARY